MGSCCSIDGGEGSPVQLDPAIFMESMNFLFLQYLQNHGRG